jgi:ABC-type multidrug transport system fused ATPase/permease subunit
MLKLRGASFHYSVEDSPNAIMSTGSTDVVSAASGQSGDAQFCLRGIDLEVQAGELVGVVGRVGAGKTSLLLGLLRELRSAGGVQIQVASDAAIAYAAQSAAIVNGTVVDNICFGLQYHEGNYQRCLNAACLTHDLKLLVAGDRTELGEKGVNLSGGQKARIAFARLLYHSLANGGEVGGSGGSGLFLMDDILSAVDADVANKMFHSGVVELLGGERATRLIVMSAHLELLQHADKVVVVEDGQIVAQGSYEALCKTDYMRQMVGSAALSAQPTDAIDGKVNGGGVHTKGPATTPGVTASIVDEKQQVNTDAVNADKDATGDMASNDPADGVLTVAEDSKVGIVKLGVYALYYDAAVEGWGGLLFVLVIILYLVGQTVRVMADMWPVWWAGAGTPSIWLECRTNSTVGSIDGDCDSASMVPRPDAFWIWSFGTWTAVSVVIAFGRTWCCVWLAVRSSRALHRSILRRLLGAPLLYFQQNPSGRTLNRFSTDLHKIDLLLPDVLYQFLDNVFILLAGFAIAFASVPWLLLLLLPGLYSYLKISSLYRQTSRELLRMEGVSKSPIFSAFARTINIRTTVRAFAAESRFASEVRALIDGNAKVKLLTTLIERWLTILLNSAAVVLTGALCVGAILLRDSVDPGVIALALVYGMSLMGLMSFVTKMVTDVENNMTSVERLRFFMSIPQEGDQQLFKTTDPGTEASNGALTVTADAEGGGSDANIPEDWPARGEIIIKGLRLRYRPELPLVLRGIGLHILPAEKIGICGRTGAGKSSVVLAMLRLFKPELGSSIVIDGVEILAIRSLKRLRSKLGVIPQEPMMFSSSLRDNIDPFHLYSDDEVWAALRTVQLEAHVRKIGWGLSGESSGSENESSVSSGAAEAASTMLVDPLAYQVSEDGANLSHGQRQLICVCRVLLRRPRVLLCDEATSSVDGATDALVQEVLQQSFADSTVLTIAHRIDTILNSSRVLVLSDGCIVEFDSPERLLEDPSSHFAQIAGKSA